MPSDRDRNESGQYADGIDPETVLDVFDAREDRARPVTASDVVDALGIARRTAHNKLNALVERGVLETRKVGARGRVWWTPLRAESGARREPRDAPGQSSSGPDDADQPPRADAGGDAGDATDATDDAPGDVLDAVADVDLPSVVDRDDAAAAIRAGRDYIRDYGGATKTDLVENVMPDHALGYDVDAALAKIDAGDRYRGAWWRRVVKPGLEALDDVQKPQRGASTWRYTGED